jgi:hypothetical protein
MLGMVRGDVVAEQDAELGFVFGAEKAAGCQSGAGEPVGVGGAWKLSSRELLGGAGAGGVASIHRRTAIDGGGRDSKGEGAFEVLNEIVSVVTGGTL